MSVFNPPLNLTGNPIGSDNPLDRDDNYRVFDVAFNSTTEESVLSRQGVELATLYGLQQQVSRAIADIGNAATGDLNTSFSRPVIRTFAEIAQQSWLTEGMQIETLGFHNTSIGGARYEIKSGTTADGVTSIRIAGKKLIAVLLPQGGEVLLSQVGGYAKTSKDSTAAAQYLVNYCFTDLNHKFDAVIDSAYVIEGRIGIPYQDVNAKCVNRLTGRGGSLFIPNGHDKGTFTSASHLLNPTSSDNTYTAGILFDNISVHGVRSATRVFDGDSLYNITIKDCDFDRILMLGTSSRKKAQYPYGYFQSFHVQSNRFSNIGDGLLGAILDGYQGFNITFSDNQCEYKSGGVAIRLTGAADMIRINNNIYESGSVFAILSNATGEIKGNYLESNVYGINAGTGRKKTIIINDLSGNIQPSTLDISNNFDGFGEVFIDYNSGHKFRNGLRVTNNSVKFGSGSQVYASTSSRPAEYKNNTEKVSMMDTVQTLNLDWEISGPYYKKRYSVYLQGNSNNKHTVVFNGQGSIEVDITCVVGHNITRKSYLIAGVLKTSENYTLQELTGKSIHNSPVILSVEKLKGKLEITATINQTVPYGQGVFSIDVSGNINGDGLGGVAYGETADMCTIIEHRHL